MNRYAIENLFGIEGLNIAWYGIIIACGMVLDFALAEEIDQWRQGFPVLSAEYRYV